MRVAQVSGHYPPNFVSGGTLVPQRLARAAARAGHESMVFAGYLDEGRPPLETWVEDDGSGVEVTWVVTTPWIYETDRRNYDNPAVEAAFRTWLELRRPDVVHFHSIQTLGGSLLPAAKEAGARVVLTMHDFWWFCSHQFLVDRQMRFRGLVVSCGARGGEEQERTARLREMLSHADVVLAPSAIARDVFVANGVDPDRIRVDENGIENPPARAGAGRTGDGALRLLYTGGPNPLKGWGILRGAAELLGERDDLILDAYGIDRRDAEGLPHWVRPHPQYGREEIEGILASHDFLVLPSIMRESHSIVTREALGAGLAVVCSDTLGPEEAVRHGYNGLVVPAGSTAALADALTGLAADAPAARELTGRGSVSPIRDLSDQIAGDLALYDELVNGSAQRSPAPASPVRSVLFVVGIDGAPLRYRAQLPAEALEMQGVRTYVRSYRDPELPSLAARVDAVVLYRVPATDDIMSLTRQIRRHRRVPLLFDVDDLIFDLELRGQLAGLSKLPPAEQRMWWRGVARYRTTMEACDVYIGSTAELCRQAERVVGMPSARFPNGVGRLLAQQSDRALARPRSAGPIRIGYFSGTSTHDHDWAVVEPVIVRVMQRHPEVELWLGGLLEPSRTLDAFGDRVRRMPFRPWYELPAVLRDTDICLAPLALDNRFNEAKSAIKWLEAALVATPTIASPTEPFREAIDPGRTGFLAGTEQEWEEAVELLIGSAAERARVGAQAQREALLHYSPEIQGRRYLAILEKAVARVRLQGHRPPSDWEPVTDDERLDATRAHVDPYALPRTPVRRSRLRAAGGIFVEQGLVGLGRSGTRLARRAARVAVDEGLVGVARRIVR